MGRGLVAAAILFAGVSPARAQTSAPAAVSPAERSTLDALVAEADLVVLARVRTVHRIRQSEPRLPRSTWPDNPIVILELEVEETLMAPPDLERVLVALPSTFPGADVLQREGQAALFFLRPEQHLLSRAKHGFKVRLEGVLEGRALLRPMDMGVLLVDTEQDVVQWPVAWKGPLASEAGAMPVARAVEIVRQRVKLLTPSLTGRLVSTSPYPWSVRIAPDGSWGAAGEHLTREATSELWKRVEASAPHSWPASIGHSRGPCSSWLILELRTELGVRRTRVMQSVEAPDAVAVEWRARFKGILELLPEADRVREAYF